MVVNTHTPSVNTMTSPVERLKAQITELKSKGQPIGLLEARLIELELQASIADTNLKARQAEERTRRGL